MAVKFDIQVNNKGANKALNETQRKFQETTQRIERSGSRLDGVFSKIGSTIEDMTKSAVAGFRNMATAMVGLQALGKISGYMSEMSTNIGQFNKAMKEVSTISQDVTENMAEYKKAVVEMTTEIPIGAAEAAKALYQIVSAGQQGADALKVLKVAAKAAIGGVTDTATAADTITTLLNAYHLKASDAEAVSDKLFTTVRLGKTTMTELGASIAQAAPTAAAYGVSMDELLGAVATLTKQGVPTTIAMTQINAAISEAVNVLGDSAFEGRTFAEALGEIRDSAQGSMTALKGQITNIRALKGALGLTGDSASTAASDLQAMADSAGASEKAFRKMNDTAGASAQRLKNNFQDAFTPIAENVKSVSKSITDSLNNAFDTGAMDDYKKTLLGLVAVYGTYRTAAMITTATNVVLANSAKGVGIAEQFQMRTTILLESVQAKLNKTMLANPYVRAATAAAALAVVIYKLASATTGAEAAQQNLNQEIKEGIEAQRQYNEKVSESIDLCNNDTKGTTERRKALEFLVGKYPEIIKKYIDEEGHLTNIIKLKREIAELDGQRSIDSDRQKSADYKEYADLMRKQISGKALNQDEIKKLHEANRVFEEKNSIWTILGSNHKDRLEYFEKMSQGYTAQAKDKVADQAVAKFVDSVKSRDAADLRKWQDVFSTANGKFRKGIKRVTVKGFGALTQEQVQSLLAQLTKANEPTSGGNGNEKNYSYWEKQRDKYEAEQKKYVAGTKEFNEARKKYLQAENELRKYNKNDGSESANNKAEEARKKEAQDAQKLADVKARQELELGNKKADAILQARQYEIDAMKEGNAKTLAQIALNYDKERQAIAKEIEATKKANEDAARTLWEAQNPDAGEKGMNWEKHKSQNNLSFGLTDEQSTMFSEREKANTVKREKAIKEQNKALKQSMLDYLKEYGDIESQRLAISQEYEQKIAEAKDYYQKEYLSKERDKAIKELDAKQTFSDIDWDGVFGELEGHTKDYLVMLRNQLQKLLKENKLSDIADIQKVKEKITELNKQISKQGGIFNFKGSKAIERDRLNTELQDSRSRELQAQAELSLAEANFEILKKTGATAEELTVAETKLKKAREGVTKATNDVKDKEDAAKKKTSQKIADSMSDVSEFMSANGIDEIPNILSKIGLSKEAEKVSQGLSGVENAVSAVSDFASGNYIGAISKGISAIQDFGRAFGIGGGNEDEVNRITQENTKAIENNSKRLESLKDAMDKQSGSQAVATSKASISVQEDTNKRVIDTLQSQMGYHSAHHSNSYYADDNYIAQLYSQEVANAVQAGIDMQKSINGLNNIYSMTPEQISAIKTFMPQLWEYLTTVGKYDKSEYWEAVVEQAGKLEEITSKVNQNLTGSSLDQFKEGFMSMLMDLDSEVSDFADDMTKSITQSLLKIQIDKLLGKELEDYYNKWSDALSDDTLTEEERTELQKQYNDIVTKGKEIANNIAQVTGYDSINGGEAKSTVNSSKSMTDETANELVGRITAIQMAVNSQSTTLSTQMLQGVNYLMSLSTLTTQGNEVLNDILLQQVNANSYLSDIVKYNKAIYEGWNEKIDNISNKLNNI